MNPSTAKSYRALAERVAEATAEVRSRVRGFCGYTADDVASRYLQRCLEIAAFEFTKVYAERFRRVGELPDKGEMLDCGGIVFDGSRDISISARRFWRSLLEFIGHWLYVFAVLLTALRWRASKESVVLLHGVGIDDISAEGSDRRFLEFCEKGPIEPLNRFKRIVVQATRKVAATDPERVRYNRFPLLSALSWVGLGPQAWIVSLVRHVIAGLAFLRTILLTPRLVLLGRDAAYHVPAAMLGKAGSLGDVLITNSNYFSQPLWMWAMPCRKHHLHMIWYSQNNYPMVYCDERVREPMPNIHFVKADAHWLWTNGFADFLSQVGLHAVKHVVGPVVWCLPVTPAVVQTERIRIGLFDVTPISEEAERNLGLLRNFYSAPTLSRFIEDAVITAYDVARSMGLEIEIVLKHKRGHAAIHAKDYIFLIEKLVASGQLMLVKPTSNLIHMIDSCDAVVVAPFSSPVYVAQSRGVEGVWYDPTGMLIAPEQNPSSPVCLGSVEDLKAFYRHALSVRNDKRSRATVRQ